MSDPALDLLNTLVAIDSVNPSLVPGGAGEGEAARAVADALAGAGLAVETEEAAPGRPNVVGILEGRAAGPSLMLCGHLDTVGVAGMPAPFAPVVRDGRLYGRGAQDMKGGLAALVDAARVLARESGRRGRLLVAAVADEEYASVGAEALVRKWHADAAVVAEPTDLVIGVAHKGFSCVEAATEGVAAHGSRPREGRDAIVRMGRVLGALEELDRRLQSGPAHPLLGPPSVHASLIHGGREMSTYPDACTLLLERRSVVGEPADVALGETTAILDRLRAADPEFRGSARFLVGRPAYETPAGHPLPDALAEALTALGHTPRRGGLSFWTDAAILGEAGIPSVVFGPGGAGLHGLDEYVLVADVLTCRDALVALARRLGAAS